MRLPVSVTLIFHKKIAKRFHKGSISDIHTRLKSFTHFSFCHAARRDIKKFYYFIFKQKLKRSGFLDLQFFRDMTFEENICISGKQRTQGDVKFKLRESRHFQRAKKYKKKKQKQNKTKQNTKSAKRIKGPLSRSSFHRDSISAQPENYRGI